MKEQYPFIKEVNVTSEPVDMRSYHDKENLRYNVWFHLGDYGDFDNWEKFEEEVKMIKNALGLKGPLWLYNTEDKDEEDY